MRLARRAGMDRVGVPAKPFRCQGQHVSLNERERVSRLRFLIDTQHIEPGPMIAHTGATGLAIKVNQQRTHQTTAKNRWLIHAGSKTG